MGCSFLRLGSSSRFGTTSIEEQGFSTVCENGVTFDLDEWRPPREAVAELPRCWGYRRFFASSALPWRSSRLKLFFCFQLDKAGSPEHNSYRRIKSENKPPRLQPRCSLKSSEESYVFRSDFHFGGPGPPFCL